MQREWKRMAFGAGADYVPMGLLRSTIAGAV